MTEQGHTERLERGTRVRLPDTGEAVTLLDVRPGAFWDLVYEGADGPGKLILAEDEVGAVEVVDTPEQAPFDGDARAFRLGVEARRIDTAFTHDMAALAVSNIQPLPHQLEAVYGEFLTQPRLRFLLADDAGAGKTIMAGLYMKELELRRSGDRILVVAPANLLPQWARELEERFGFEFEQLTAAHFDASARGNPWDRYDRVVVSRDFLKASERLESFANAARGWDLAVIDEAHGFSLHTDTRGFIKDRSQRYKAGEEVARRAERLILMTATPHSGKTDSFWGLLRLLDREAYGDRCRRDFTAGERHYRKVAKEAMKDMAGQDLFRERHTRTVEFNLAGAELDLYEAVTDFVERQLREIRGDAAKRAAGFALTTMQRRLASSIRAIKRTIERRLERLERALADPEGYLRARRDFQERLVDDPDELEDLSEEDRWRLEERALEEVLPDTVEELQAEKDALEPLLAQAQDAERAGDEVKLNELQAVIRERGLWEDASRKLLIFTEHKDTLEYLVDQFAADFDVAAIHGGLKLSERIGQERYFREQAQILVATEAAGEGINLQFCHLMVNYDIPWNPNRLEQRMGRIHRIGQTRDVHIFNMVAANTREGRVLGTLLRKLDAMKGELGDGVFDVIGDTFAGYRLRDMLEAVVAGEVTAEQAVDQFHGEQVDPAVRDRAQELMETALARHHVDWRSEREQYRRAQERRLPPDYFRRFLFDAIDWLGGSAESRLDRDTIRVRRSPDELVAASRAAGATRLVAPAYERLTFDRQVTLQPPEQRSGPPPELCGPGHPLFDEAVSAVYRHTAAALDRGAVLFDPDADGPHVLAFVTGEVIDGNGDIAHRRFSTVGINPDGHLHHAAHTSLYDLVTADGDRPRPEPLPDHADPDSDELVSWCRHHLFEEDYRRVRDERRHAADLQRDFVEQSAREVLYDIDRSLIDYDDEVDRGVPGAQGRRRQAELDKHHHQQRLDNRLAAIDRSTQVRRGPVRLVGRALVLPLPETEAGDVDDHPDEGGLTNEEVERIAVGVAWRAEEGRGAVVESVERDNVGFDLLSRRDEQRRCIEVKGRAGHGAVWLSWSEFAKAMELGDDYWLYAVLDCAAPEPRLYRVHNPAATLRGYFQPNLDVRFGVNPDVVIHAAQEPQ